MNPPPSSLDPIAKLFLGFGALFLFVGIILWAGSRLFGGGSWRLLPGDIYIKRPNFVFFFPLGTSIAVSLLLSGIGALVVYFLRRG